MSKANEIKLVVIGDGAVGKTSLLSVLKGEPFPERYVPTVFDNYALDVTHNNKPYRLHIWDTAGQDEFDRLRPLSYQDAKVILICFELDKRASFSNLSDRWIAEVNYFCKEVKMILVGCKADLREQSNESVSDEEALAFAKQHGGIPYIATSARTGLNVDKVFPTAIDITSIKKKGCELI
ncbi:small GTP-binding protein, putative [Trichomonas vaginalis G3]|uniref:Small GTP-binding protein, putative n=1 Tax=Trichomonas vaginalis (strain ATCC PRA-98 / G3) TaxID=412133 RepID=A2EJI6_TRIV3|nr:small GTPase mediated signal transduction [Trichomonas vaginalis G3]EAY07156.1 small GTP-binding protein, putative [Trichomonas vaginalis G3]KAI5503673.1 small GTPase mediated signal transduction [Trichomonas vaginalis G3]|eukprot:XP_001319379.1 small GTP-binding protein [Trichomonas vaginalis G3]